MRNLAAVISLATVAAALAGCGGGEASNSGAPKSPARMLSDAAHAVRAARSVHIGGHGDSQGQPVTLDLSLVRGSQANGSMKLFGGSLDLIRIRDSVYMRGDRSFWQHFGTNQRKLALLADRWVVAPASAPAFDGIASFTEIGGLSSLLCEHGKIVNQGTRQFRGQKVVALHDSTEGGTLYLKATGIPYPVALLGGKNAHGGTVTFDRWNQHVVVRAPKNALSIATSA